MSALVKTFSIVSLSVLSVCGMVVGGVIVESLDLQSRGRGFDSQPFHFHVTSCSHTCASVTEQYRLVLAEGR